jgi:hypothetical protein
MMPKTDYIDSDSPDRTRVVLLPVDPYVIHAYWVISPDNLAKAELLLGKDYNQATLRFYDIACSVFDGSKAQGFFDVPIDLHAQNWYLRLWSPGKAYCADLGLRTEDHRFFPLARSNVAETPRACPSTRAKACYLLVEGDYKHVEQISAGGLERDPMESEALAEDRQLHSEKLISFIRSLKISLVADPCVDLTELSEQGFVRGISSTLSHPSTGKTGR